MKLFAILCFIGLAASVSVNQVGPLKWKPAVYHFKYEGRLLTGIPELSTQYSGLGLKCDVEVTVNEERKFGIKIRNPQYVRVNEELQGDGNERNNNWRKLRLPSFASIPEESQRFLASPIVFQYSSNGEFETLTINQEEPDWSVNFKKALVTILQTKFQEITLNGAENNMIETTSDEENSINYWKTSEESLDGNCDVVYQINELPSYMIKEKPDKVPYPEGCPGGNESKYYGIVKTRDVSSCSKRKSFIYYKPGFFRCTTGNCEGMWSRSSMTRYIACGSRNNLRIQSIENEGELQQNLLGFKTEKFLTGTKQTLKLVKESSMQSQVEYPQNPIAMNNLYYEYSFNKKQTNGKLNGNQGESLLNQLETDESSIFRNLPRNILQNGQLRNEQNNAEFVPSKLIPQMKELFKQLIDNDLFDVENVAEKQVTMKALSLARAFASLDQEQIGQLYNELKGEFSGEEKKQIFKNIFFDTLVMGGSVSDIMFIKEKIQNGELNRVQTISFFTFLPHYVIAPTRHLLFNLYELVTSSHVRDQPQVYNHALMGFTTLLQKACVADNRETSYPTFVFGDFCSPDSEIVLVKWIPYLQKELNEARNAERKNLLIVTLGLLGHKNVLPALVPYIENLENKGQQGETNQLTRFLAVYSLNNVGRKFPEQVLPLLFSVFNNRAENNEVRIAAFNVMLRLEPSMTVFHKIASTTWQETNQEVLQVVNTAFWSLSQQEQRESIEVTGSSLPRKAWLVYPLIKKTGGVFPTSASIHTSDYLKLLGIGYRSTQSWIQGRDSPIPSDMYSRIVYYLDRYQFSPLEVAVRFNGAENLIQQVVELLDPEYQPMARDELSERVKEQLHGEWKNVIEQLRIKTREAGNAEGALYLNLFEDSPMFVNFQSSSAEMLREKVSKVLQNKNGLRQLLDGENNLNFQRTFDISPSEFSIPSDMGFPIVIEVHMPVTMSVHGQYNSRLIKRSPSVQMNVRTLFAAQLIGWVGTICPFTQEYTVTGIDKHTVINIPAEFNIEASPDDHTLKMKLKPISVSKPIDILHFHIRPFTVHEKMWDLKPMTLSNNMKYIQSRSELKKLNFPYGDYIGVSLNAHVSTESAFVDFRTVLQKFRMFNSNVFNMLRFSWASGALTENGYPSLRRHEIKVVYDASASSTKEIEFQLQYGYGTKLAGKSIKIHQLQVEERQLEREGLLPFKVVERELNEINRVQAHHQKVQQLLEESQLVSGRAANIRYTILFKGSRTSTISYSLNFVSGFDELRQKWDVQLESEKTGKKICVKGIVAWPSSTSTPVWKLQNIQSNNFEFRYENEIAFGTNCQESKVKIEGSSRVSQNQKEISRHSQEAKFLKNLIESGSPLAELSEVAEQVRRQASSLDEVDFNIKYENVPERYMVVSEYLIEYLKAAWWPNLVKSEGNPSQQEGQGSRVNENSSIRIRISSETQTFDLTINRPNNVVRFSHVRIPYPFNYLFPLPAHHIRPSHYHALSGLAEIVTGSSGKWNPKCKVEGNWLKTYDNQTTKFHSDDCYHLLSGDCSSRKQFAVLIREVRSGREALKELKVYLGKTDIRLTPSERHSKYSSDIQVYVNGTEVQVSSRKHEIITDHRGNYIAEVKLSEDGVLILKSRFIDILFDADKVVVEASYMNRDKLCGLCGDVRQRRVVSGPQECIYSNPELLAASYRVELPSRKCQPLREQIKRDLELESAQCTKYQEIPSKVVRAFESQSGECFQHRHEIIDRHNQICFSRHPVTECGNICRPRSSEDIVDKKVSFSCLSKNRMSEHYAQKVREGQVLQELENLPESFSVKMQLPRTCVQVSNNL